MGSEGGRSSSGGGGQSGSAGVIQPVGTTKVVAAEPAILAPKSCRTKELLLRSEKTDPSRAVFASQMQALQEKLSMVDERVHLQADVQVSGQGNGG